MPSLKLARSAVLYSQSPESLQAVRTHPVMGASLAQERASADPRTTTIEHATT
jgi:hypothetical protein